jgi:hypothetical protein
LGNAHEERKSHESLPVTAENVLARINVVKPWLGEEPAYGWRDMGIRAASGQVGT